MARLRVLAGLGVLVLAVSACASLAGLGPDHTLTTGTYRLGPFNLSPTGEPGWQSEASQANVPRPAGNIGVHNLDFDIVYSDGTPVGHHVHLHHLLLFKNGASDPVCSSWPLTFGGSGAERTPGRLWSDYALRFTSTDRWNSTWHIMNMMDHPMQVYIQYKVGYDTDTGSNHRGVTPYFLDVTGCGGGVTWDVPGTGGPGSVQTSTRDWTAPADAVAVGGGTHLHDGGIDGKLTRLSDGKVGCRAAAVYDDEGMLVSIPACIMHAPVAQGTVYRQTIRYDNSEPHNDVMGIHLLYLWHGTPPAS